MSTEIKTLKDLIAELKTLQEQADDIEATLKEKNKEISAVRGKIVSTLSEDGLDSFETPDAKVFVKNVYSYKLPQGDDRVAFFNYLKANGQEDMLTVNSQTYNSFCKKKLEEALANGKTSVDIPGVGEPSLFQQLNMRKR